MLKRLPNLAWQPRHAIEFYFLNPESISDNKKLVHGAIIHDKKDANPAVCVNATL